MLRELMHCAQFVQSHALSFFHLSAPDLLLGMDSDPAHRNVFGLIEEASRAGQTMASRCASSASRSSRAGQGAHASLLDRARRRQ
jgi:coenzyme F420-reducing hydrogenase alpha subunit